MFDVTLLLGDVTSRWWGQISSSRVFFFGGGEGARGEVIHSFFLLLLSHDS